MKKILFILYLLPFISIAQPDVKSLYATARSYMFQGDLENATLVLNKALEIEPYNLEMQKDKAYILYLKRDFSNALSEAKKITERTDADVQSFQMLGLIYKAIAETKEAEKLYKNALQKFPESGVLYSEYGGLLYERKNQTAAITQWEKGIQVDPNHSSNYYYASKFYSEKGELVWSFLYAEVFINIESFSNRTKEIKALLLDNYKKLLQQPLTPNKTASQFTQVVTSLLEKQRHLALEGVTPITLTKIRNNFITDWLTKYAQQFPFRLFDHHKQLIKEEAFNAYNQWLFSEESNSSYQNWVQHHQKEMDTFKQLQKNRIFKLPKQQYYR